MKDEYLEDVFEIWWSKESLELLKYLNLDIKYMTEVKTACKIAWYNGVCIERNGEIKWH